MYQFSQPVRFGWPKWPRVGVTHIINIQNTSHRHEFIHKQQRSERARYFFCVLYLYWIVPFRYLFIHIVISLRLYSENGFCGGCFSIVTRHDNQIENFRLKRRVDHTHKKKTVASLSVCAVRVCNAWEHNSHRFDIYILHNAVLWPVEWRAIFSRRKIGLRQQTGGGWYGERIACIDAMQCYRWRSTAFLWQVVAAVERDFVWFGIRNE